MTAVKHTTESTFAKLGVRDEIVRALGEEGIKRPFAIQELTLPLALNVEPICAKLFAAAATISGVANTYDIAVLPQGLR